MNTAVQFKRSRFKFIRPLVHRVYTIPCGSRIYCPVVDGSRYIVTGVMGNMHSPCITEKGGLVYLSNAQPLKLVQDHYELA